MSMELVPATAEDRSALLALGQLYTYDFSDLLGLDVDGGGRFDEEPFARHFDDALCHPFLVRVDGKLAGFALHEGRSRLTGEPGVNDVAQFFVLRKYRRLGVGARAAVALFDRFAGAWEVRQVPTNTAATAFWRRVIARYTAGVYEEVAWDDARYRGTVQRFHTHSRVATEP